MSWVPSPKKKKKKNDDKQAKIYAGNQTSEERAWVKKGSGPQQGYPVLQNSLRRGTPLPPRC